MVYREVTITVNKQFCDICDEMEENNEFQKCDLCGRVLCPKCQIKFDPFIYKSFIVCSNCIKPEFHGFKEMKDKAIELHKQLGILYVESDKLVEEIKEKYNYR
jgi:hypothetical protein